MFKGELGSGKTTLIKSILKNLGVKENITSPTFSIVNQYLISNRLINHFDLYRIKSLTELDVIGFEEYLKSGAVCFIEWPEIAMSKIVDNYIEIYIKFINDKTREITLKKFSQHELYNQTNILFRRIYYWFIISYVFS